MKIKVCTGCHLPKTIDLFHKNKARYDGLSNYCKSCQSSRLKIFRSKNIEKLRTNSNNYYKHSKALILLKQKKYRRDNKEKIALRMSKYYLLTKPERVKTNKSWKAKNQEYIKDYNVRYGANPETVAKKRIYQVKNKDRIRAAAKVWMDNNPGKNAQYKNNRRHRVPPWITESMQVKIDFFYWLAKTVTKIFGVPHRVDHFIPLKGKLVSGLHVPSNLQVITEKANAEKSNKFTPTVETVIDGKLVLQGV